ncbi:MAG TPA: GDYXXLXY domain-containing protein, partial [Flavitalea sp.]|nr:GDYXXLXY domain-containing protein [Flavitalea sp.]
MKPFLPILFLLVIIVQLCVPASVVFNQERIHLSGTTHKMQLAPIDPNDPFRGKYIILSFRENIARIPKDSSFKKGEPVFVLMTPGKNDFLKIEMISHGFQQVTSPSVCIPATIGSIMEADGYKEARLVYPF